MALPTTCNPKVIDDFLSDRLDDVQQSAFEHHLDQCDECCRELQQRTADHSLWNDARTFLSSTDNVRIDVADETTSVATDSPSTDMLRLDFLGPTDDPRMLGRFAGYEVSGVVGCGGMGIVLKGFDAALNRYAAIKVLSPHYASSTAARQRFARQAQAAAAVVHDNVIAIHGVAEFNGLPYLVMPYIKGQSLQKRIDREGSLSVAEVLRIAMQAARGLAAAHEQGLVHRDIKPANILLPENVERVIITDFGLARAADDASLTRSGVIAGTPQYMSPEQARGEGVGARSDLFSLGSVIYTMCAGHPPFRAETPYGILRRITDNEPRPIRELNPETPDWLCSIVSRLHAKDAEKRFASAEEVADLLAECLAHVQQSDVVPLPAQLRHGSSLIGHRWQIGVCAGGFATVAALMMYGPVSETAPSAQHTGRSSEAGAVIASADKVTTEEPAVTPNAAPGTQHTVVLSPEAVQQKTPFEADLKWSPGDGLDRIEKTLFDLKSELTNQNRQG
ncbi:MAG: serine/threonine protein kinase [Fuerstiella sp.]|nr:serine/threonine protein kinase [Fuerstiella sp.]